MNFKKVLQYIFALAIIVAVGYFFYLESKKNWDAIRAYHFAIDFYYIAASIIVMMIGFLMETYIWQILVNDYLTNKLNFLVSIALYNTTAMLKYMPGKIWTYTAQIALMSSKGISKAVLIYINIICFICLTFVSAIYVLYYYFFYLQMTPWGISILIFILLIFLDFVFIIWNTPIINYLIIHPINRIFKREIRPIKMRKLLLVYVQLLYLFAYVPAAIGMYFLAKGIGVEISFFNILPIIATLSLSLVLGYIAFFSPGGLGIREGTMFVMLKQFSNIKTALILPIAMRLIYIIIELLLGIIGILVGMKYGYFSNQVKNRQTQ
ncbi:MAG: lysylphosphatidylglycerol synthase domain-containing protein [Deltaproteobacteria bacterium]|nr:lysylphosphatidylglycerol synthase domain-containing protein [Deltaproteobacteria bacterium]